MDVKVFSACSAGRLATALFPTAAWLLACTGLPQLGRAEVPGRVDFVSEVKPILTEHCIHCHGQDAESRESGLRLDVREAALRGGDSGLAALVVGSPRESELVRRIHSKDPNTMMPPPAENHPLTDDEKAILENWITQGAEYADHWAFVPPRKVKPPSLEQLGAPIHPIDAFVGGHLAERAITPSPRADATTLCRRLYLDLVGVPPSLEDLRAFNQEGFEATVEKLLASPRYGEKWARHWLDLARYSDSNGYEKDLPREMWAWRDWVIAAFNRDMPFDTFVIEQIAGDLLPSATQDQWLATGFLRNSMLNEEGAIVAEEFRMVEMFDRIDCVGKAVLGLTTQCAQCHAHKFDPITQEEYYGLFAFLNDTYEARSYVYTPEQLEQLASIRAEVKSIEDEIRGHVPTWQAEMNAWADAAVASLPRWTPLVMREMASDGMLTHPTQRADGSILMIGHRDSEIFLESELDGPGATGLQLELLTDGDLFMNGPGRDGPWTLAGMDVQVKTPGATEWSDIKLVNATADFSEAETIVQRTVGDKQESSPFGPVEAMIDDDEYSAWRADRGHLLRHQPSVAVVQFEQPLETPPGTGLRVALRWAGGGSREGMIGCCRVSLTQDAEPAAPPIDHAAILAARTPTDQRTPEDSAAIFTAWRKTIDSVADHNERIAAAWARVPRAPTTVLHTASRSPAHRRPTHLLDRGVWNQPKQEVLPHVPAALHPLVDSQDPPRLAFAKWLVDPQSPLTARVAVNRIWQVLFGHGLVETPDDFGTRTAVPEYRELLDWLAVRFMEEGWSRKELIRLIVSSETYRQSSMAKPEAIADDPTNRLLARGPRFRPDAEVVRDLVLAASGLLSEKIGGPSVYPPVPQNVLDFNYVKISWPTAQGADRYRRSLYTFRRRSMPDPAMAVFDAPTGDISCARRLRSNTPMAALAGLNETIFVEAARALALRTLREAGEDDASRIDHAFQLCTSRLPREEERRELLGFLESQRKRLSEGWLDAREIATGDPQELPKLPMETTPQDAAAWTLVSRVLLNLDETLTKN